MKLLIADVKTKASNSELIQLKSDPQRSNKQNKKTFYLNNFIHTK